MPLPPGRAESGGAVGSAAGGAASAGPVLRRAFMETMKDPAFLGEAEKIKLEITPVDGEAVQRLVAEIYATPRDIVRQAAQAVR